MTDRAQSQPSAAQPTPAELERTRRGLAITLTASGVLMIGIAIFAGAVAAPAFYALALVAVGDFVIAWMYASGRIGAKPRTATDHAAIAEVDPAYNPYARED